jgi:thermitase
LYSSFGNLLNSPPIAQGEVILLTIDRQGRVGADSRLASYNVTAAVYVPETRHRVASVFWDYLNSSGPIAINDSLVNGKLFDPWFYATGYPVTEAYWAQVKVRGQVRDVLVQCFERRCLTYTPSNDPGWEVEMGNVGQHYYNWRYGTQATAPHDPTVLEIRRPASIYEPRYSGPY